MSMKKLISYLNQRGVTDNDYLEFVTNIDKTVIEIEPCELNNFEFMVSHFLNDSDSPGYGLIATNQILQTDRGEWLAIALIEGDDVVCMNTHTGAIHIWMVQTGDSEYIEVAKSFKRFINACSA